MIQLLGPQSWPSLQHLKQHLLFIQNQAIIASSANTPIPPELSVLTLTSRARCKRFGQSDTKIAYGITSANVFGGKPRLDAIAQIEALWVAGVVAPKLTESLREAKMLHSQGVTLWGRKRIHTQGQDIVGYGHPRWAKSEWWVEVIPNITQEWRIHVFDGRVIGRGLKTQTQPATRKLLVRSRSNGWTMVHNVDPPDSIRDAARQALVAVGYDFGAVDLVLCEDGSVVVLEVNKAPAIRSDYTLGCYTKAIVRYALRPTE